MKTKTIEVVNTLFGTSPVIIHAHGSHDHKPNWLPIKNAFFDLPARKTGRSSNVTVVTCNNGHKAMGLLERSLDHIGAPYMVFGQGIDPWVNAIQKPLVLFEALSQITTPYVIYADSRDAIMTDDPAIAVEQFIRHFKCKMLFGADRINWPPIKAFRAYEDDLAQPYNTEFRYLNGGAWIGETAFCKTFFEAAMNTSPEQKATESEQGILKNYSPYFNRILCSTTTVISFRILDSLLIPFSISG
jgi:hypothetical protein